MARKVIARFSQQGVFYTDNQGGQDPYQDYTTVYEAFAPTQVDMGFTQGDPLAESDAKRANVTGVLYTDGEVPNWDAVIRVNSDPLL